jgi:formylglycine-generating enzyme required for sulfatase activity
MKNFEHLKIMNSEQYVQVFSGKLIKMTLALTALFFIGVPFIKAQVLEPDMIYVEGSTFTMGTNTGEDDEKPAHKVNLNSFYIGKFEVTVRLYKQFCEMEDKEFPAAPSKRPDPVTGEDWFYEHDNVKDWVWNDDWPIVNVSWNDAVEFCQWLSDFTGRKYRLPTEAEWEYAARGGKKSKGYLFSGSNKVADVAWYDETTNEGGLKAVGKKKANELGIYDMSGNAWEWCSDYYDSKYYVNSPLKNPQGPSTGLFRVIRGGSWYFYEDMCRVYTRDGPRASEKNWNYGFRVVLDQ